MTSNSNTIKILFFGDIVGKPGRLAVRDFLCENENSKNFDFIIANVENASHGFGLTEKNYNEFIEYGINAMTCGNHIWDKKEIFNYIDDADKLIRPINYPQGTKGVGSKIFETKNFKIGVICVLGRVFMNLADSPWKIVEEEIEKIKKITPVIVIDFHAEATAEKICFAKYFSQFGVSAIFGTHTHVQTADEQILNETTGYITDAGFCGASDGVIGMEYETSLLRLTTAIPQRYEIAPGQIVQINAIEIEVDPKTGKTSSIKRIITSNKIKEESKNED